MEIIPYDPALAPALARNFNDLTAAVPHCYGVEPETFAQALAGAANGAGHKSLRAEQVLVARALGTVLGFVHLGIEKPEDDEEDETGIIRFLSYPSGRRAVGQALLERAEGHLRDQEIARIEASRSSYRYPFYHFPNAYLSDHLGHIQALYQFNSYDRTGGEIFFDWEDYPLIVPEPHELAGDILLEWQEGQGSRPGLEVQAHHDGQHIGTCGSVSGGNSSTHPRAQDWHFTTWLGVNEPYQGKRLGFYLLQRCLAELRGIGYRHASISTSWTNHRAFLFYSNFGYRVADRTYGFGRDLAGGEDGP